MSLLESKPAVVEPTEGTPAPATEKSSLVRWILLAAVVLVGALSVPTLIRLLPTEMPRTDSVLPFPVATTPKGPPGKVVLLEDPTYKFGVMPQKTTGTHTWVFKNEGQGDLELRKGYATCSCTIANFTNAKPYFTLKAGDKTEITLTWETREVDGKFSKSADIDVVGDPGREKVTFAIEGTVRPAIAVMPKDRVLAFGTLPNDQNMSGKFAVASADHPEMKIVSLSSSNPEMLKLTPVPLGDEDRKGLEWTAMKGGYLINVEVLPSKNLGVFNEEIVVTTDHPLQKELRLAVGGKRTGPISVVPETVRMHSVNADEGQSQAVMLLVRNAIDTKIAVESAPENLKVEIIPSDVKVGAVAKVRQYRMIVTVAPGAPAGLIGGEIVLRTDHPEASIIRVPVEVIVLGGS